MGSNPIPATNLSSFGVQFMNFRIGFVGCSGLQGKRWNGDSNFLADLAIVSSLLESGNFVYWIGFDDAKCMIPKSLMTHTRFSFISLPFDMVIPYDLQGKTRNDVVRNYARLNSNYDEFKMVDRLTAFLKTDVFEKEIELDFLIKDYQKVLFLPLMRTVLPCPLINQVHLTQSFIMQECNWSGYSESDVHMAALYDAFEYSAAIANIFASEHNMNRSLALIEQFVSPQIIESIRKRCYVVPFPFSNFGILNEIRQNRDYSNKKKVVITFPHRLNSDRNPAGFLHAVRNLLEREPELNLAIVLCKFDQMRMKESFKDDYVWLKEKGVVFNKAEFLGEFKVGYANSDDIEKDVIRYLKVLAETDIVVCASAVESFGISFREAILAGAYPLLDVRCSVYKEAISVQGFPFKEFGYNGTEPTSFELSLRTLIDLVQTDNIETSKKLLAIVPNQNIVSPQFVSSVYGSLLSSLKCAELQAIPAELKGKAMRMKELLQSKGIMTKQNFMEDPSLSWVNPLDFYGLKNKLVISGVRDNLDCCVPTYSI